MEPRINQRIRAIRTLSPGFAAQRRRLLDALARFRDLQTQFERAGKPDDAAGDALWHRAYAAHGRVSEIRRVICSKPAHGFGDRRLQYFSDRLGFENYFFQLDWRYSGLARKDENG